MPKYDVYDGDRYIGSIREEKDHRGGDDYRWKDDGENGDGPSGPVVWFVLATALNLGYFMIGDNELSISTIIFITNSVAFLPLFMLTPIILLSLITINTEIFGNISDDEDDIEDFNYLQFFQLVIFSLTTEAVSLIFSPLGKEILAKVL